MEALKGPYANAWKASIQKEFEQMKEKGVYEVVERTSKMRPCGSRIVLKLKTKPDGSFDKRKSRWVAQGFSQIPGIDFDVNKVYAPVISYVTIRVMLSIAAIQDWHVEVADVVGAYLNTDMDIPIYIKPPKGHELYGTNKVLKLVKALYGLKQSAHLWNKEIDKFMIEEGFKRLETDAAAYVRRLDGTTTMVGIFVDDILIMSKTKMVVRGFKEQLSRRFRINDLGEIKSILGMSVKRDRKNRTIKLTQEGYISEIARRFEINDITAHTPTKSTDRLKKANERDTIVNQVMYQRLIGSLLFATMTTRFEIRHRVRELCTQCAKPTKAHLDAATRVLGYLATHDKIGLTLGGGEVKIKAYCDVSFASDPEDRKSISGYSIHIGSGAVMCESKKIGIVAQSTMEAEYCGLLPCAKSIAWLRSMLSEMNFTQQETTTIYEDNEATIEHVRSGKVTKRNRHIELRYHGIKDYARKGIIDLKYVSTKRQVADILTKNLSRSAFEKMRAGLMKNGEINE